MKTAKSLLGILTISAVLAVNSYSQLSTPIRSGFDQHMLGRSDDGSSDSVSLGFTINFYGCTRGALYVNNNGNVTFDQPQAEYAPMNLLSLGIDIIAPFWADVDTRNPASDVVKFGTGTVNGCDAFGVDWVNVGYYSRHVDNLLSCQLVIIGRSDVAPGDFDLEFNYEKVQWQWGDVTGCTPPRAGFANCSRGGYELPGSGVDGAFMDTNMITGLIYNSINSSEPGRYVFSFRDGVPVPVPEPSTTSFLLIGVLGLMIGALKRRRTRFLTANADEWE